MPIIYLSPSTQDCYIRYALRADSYMKHLYYDRNPAIRQYIRTRFLLIILLKGGKIEGYASTVCTEKEALCG